MPFGLFILVLSVFFPLLMWIIKNEEKVIEFEDEIFMKIRARFFKESETNENKAQLYVVKSSGAQEKKMRRDFSIEERNFVA